MAEENDIAVTVKAVFSEFVESMKHLSSTVKEQTEGMKSSFEGLQQGIEKVRGAFIAIASVLAGGKMFSESVSAAEKFDASVVRLSETLGITMEKASGLKIALDDIGMSSEAYEGLATRLSRQVRAQSDELEKMGLKTRDASGQLRPMNDLVVDAIKVIGEYRAGTDRNIAMQVAFGRGTQESYEKLKRLVEQMSEGEATAKRLGVLLGDDAKEQLHRYQLAVNDAKDVFEALEVKIGNGVMPVLTDLAHWFAEYGPTAISAFRAVFDPLVDVFRALGSVVRGVALVVVDAIGTMVIAAKQGWASIKEALSGNALLAEAHWAVATIKIRELWASTSKDIRDDARETAKVIRGVADAPKPAGGGASTGGKGAGGLLNDPNGATRIDTWKAELEQLKLEQGGFFKDMTSIEISFWEEKLNAVKQGSKEEVEIRSQLYALNKQQAQNALSEQLADIKTQIEAVKGNYEQQELLATQAANVIGQAYGYESAQYARATQDILKFAQQRQQELNQLAIDEIERKRAHYDTLVAMQEENAQHMLAMGDITDEQFLAQERTLMEQEYQLELASLEDKLNFLDTWSDAYQQTLAKIRNLVDQHNVDLLKADDKAKQAHLKTIEGYLTPVQSAIEQSINGMILGTQTLQKAMANIGQSILAEFVKLGVAEVKTWIAKEVAKTQATIVANEARTAAEVAAAATGKTAEDATGISSIMKDAYEAAAGAYKAVVGIPYVGPALAPVAAGVSFAAVAAYRSAFSSAEGGYDIPTGVNPVTQLHAREMVLPAEHADVIRGMAGGGGGGMTVHLNVQAMDARSFHGFLISNRDAVAAALRGALRDFTPVPR